jgi:hypothetical protein
VLEDVGEGSGWWVSLTFRSTASAIGPSSQDRPSGGPPRRHWAGGGNTKADCQSWMASPSPVATGGPWFVQQIGREGGLVQPREEVGLLTYQVGALPPNRWSFSQGLLRSSLCRAF